MKGSVNVLLDVEFNINDVNNFWILTFRPTAIWRNIYFYERANSIRFFYVQTYPVPSMGSVEVTRSILLCIQSNHISWLFNFSLISSTWNLDTTQLWWQQHFTIFAQFPLLPSRPSILSPKGKFPPAKNSFCTRAHIFLNWKLSSLNQVGNLQLAIKRKGNWAWRTILHLWCTTPPPFLCNDQTH